MRVKETLAQVHSMTYLCQCVQRAYRSVSNMPDLFTYSLPCVCFRGRAAGARPNFVKPLHLLVGQSYFDRTQAAFELLHGARADDRRGDVGVVQQPCQRDISWLLADFAAEALVGFQFLAIFLHGFLHALVRAASFVCLLQRTAKQTAAERAPWE